VTDGCYRTVEGETIVLLRRVDEILNNVKLAGKVRRKMYPFCEERLYDILQGGLEMLGMLIANENSGIIRVAMVELWAGLNVALSIDSVLCLSTHR
jgi:hypothetical protein